jgi:TrmH family RNA methyltransferase
MQPFKADLKWVKSLHQKKVRQESSLFFAEGKKMVEEAVQSPLIVKALFSTDESFVQAHKGAFLLKEREMQQISALSEPPGYLAVLEQPKEFPIASTVKKVILLDGIADPGNMGTIIRTAEWFGVEAILLTDDCVDLYNPKVVQSSMGSIFRIETIRGSAEGLSAQLKNNQFLLWGADLEGENLFHCQFPEKMALVIGSESHGIRPEMEKLIDRMIHIPGSGKAESLNASIAAGIMMSFWAKGA